MEGVKIIMIIYDMKQILIKKTFNLKGGANCI